MNEQLGPRHLGHHGACTISGEHYHTNERPLGDSLPIGAHVAAALMAANIPCDSGEDVDRFLSELGHRGYVLHNWRAEREAIDKDRQQDIAEAVERERARIAEAVEGLPYRVSQWVDGYNGDPIVPVVQKDAVLALVKP